MLPEGERKGPPPPGDLSPTPATTQEPTPEKEELPPIFCVYRDNDLFKRYMPKVLDTYRRLGYRIETKVFPQGTDQRTIQQWFEQHEDIFNGKVAISDYTCSGPEYVRDQEVLKYSRRNPLANLDNFFNQTMQHILFGGDAREKLGSDKNMVPEMYGMILKGILKNQENVPKEVIIVPDRLNEHFPFRTSGRWEGWMGEAGNPFDRSELQVELARSLREQSGIQIEAGPIEEDQTTEEAQDRCYAAALKLKQWFSAAGIPDETITIGSPSDWNKPGTWIIFDRHNSDVDYNGAIEFTGLAHKLRVPIETFFVDAIGQGLIEFSPGKLEHIIEEIIRELAPKHFTIPKEEGKDV